WHSTTISNKLAMLRYDFVVNRNIVFVTLPFHLKFQRLLYLVEAANAHAFAEIISRFQTRALVCSPRKSLSADDREILQAMNLSLDEIAAARRAFMRGMNSAALERLTEVILSFASTSPSSGFSPSSW